MSNTMPIFKLLRYIRDARSTHKAERALLNALAMRCNPARKFTCWPSYRLLALDTLLDEVTLKRAAKRLEDAGLIKRVVRANRSNLFFLNVPKLIEQAAEAEIAKKANTTSVEEEKAPFGEVSFGDSDANEEAIEDDETYYEDDEDGFGGGAQ